MRLLLPILLIILLAGQVQLAAGLPAVAAATDFTPPPNMLAAHAVSLGDDEFFFRSRSLLLQHTGNLDGTVTPYNQLNYVNLQAWLGFLDCFNPAAQITPTMAMRLFGNTQNGSDTRYVIDYLEQRALARPGDNWRWLGEAVYLARFRLQDLDRAQGLAQELASLPLDLPGWTRDLEIFVLNQRGDKIEARQKLALLSATLTSPYEQRWASYYQGRILGGGE